MVLAHVVDAWTRDPDRDRPAYYRTIFVGGLAAPAFLFLAGVGSALSAASSRRRGHAHAVTTRALVIRGLTIFGLAFVFRIQSLVLGLGHPVDVLKVDILNVMGPALVVAAIVWGMVRADGVRALIAVAVTASLAFAAPLVQDAAWVEALPAPLRWYLQPTAGHTNFTLLPYTAFVTAGLAAGIALTATRGEWGERWFQLTLAGLATAGFGAAYWASFQPTIYPPGTSTFWGPSPAFFFLRLGLVAALLPCCWALRRAMPSRIGTLLATLGAASLFVYWVHVELVYGGIAILIKRRVPLELTIAAALTGAYGLARLVPIARRWVAAPAGRPEPLRRLVARLL
jgi:uncharacterized membrane protein